MRSLGLLLLACACAPEADPSVPPSDLNAAPEVTFARLACEGLGNDALWVLEAEVDDADGLDDVVGVSAFVYDEATSEGVAEFALDPQADGSWLARIPAGESGLDCAYTRYSADFVVADASGASDAITTFVQVALGG